MACHTGANACVSRWPPVVGALGGEERCPAGHLPASCPCLLPGSHSPHDLAPGMNRFSKLAGLLVIALSFGIIVVPLIFSFSWRGHTIHARMAEKGGWTPQIIEA